MRSSRQIERRTHEDVAFRVLAGNQHPDHDTIADFRQRNLEAVAKLFVQVLRLCQKAGLVKLGHVCIDGTKVKANASKHKAMSYERMNETEKRLAANVLVPPDRQKRSGAAEHNDMGPQVDSAARAMREKLQAPANHQQYAQRKAVVEPVFGQIKEARGIRRFLLRGLDKASAEWTIICLTHNLLKLFRAQTAQFPAAALG